MNGESALRRQCVFCLPNTSELVKHKIWDCIQANRAWRWATFIMHKCCGIRTSNYDSFNWKQAFFWEMTCIKIWQDEDLASPYRHYFVVHLDRTQ